MVVGAAAAIAAMNLGRCLREGDPKGEFKLHEFIFAFSGAVLIALGILWILEKIWGPI